MGTPLISRDLRERIVKHYEEDPEATYFSTASLFDVGSATVNRILRLKRRTGEVVPEIRPVRRTCKMDRAWLDAHVRAFPDARLKDRVEAYEAERHIRVGLSGAWYALTSLGYTHKKKRCTPRNATPNA
jgi:transposase